MTITELLTSVQPGSYGVTVPWRREALVDRGPSLPLGHLVGGAVARGYEFKPATNRVSQALGAIKARPELKRRPGRLVATCLAEALSSLGDQAFTGEKPPSEGDRLNAVSGLPFIDVVSLVFARAVHRRALLTPIPAPPATDCPKCHKAVTELQLVLAQTRLPVWDWTPDNPVRAVVALSAPLVVGGKSTTKVILGPPAWGRAINDLSEAGIENDQEFDARLATASIMGGDDGVEGGFWASLLPQMLDDVSDWDMELLIAASRGVGADIVPIVQAICPHCEEMNGIPLSWRQVPFC